MSAIPAITLFIATAIAEIAGCYFAYLWIRESGSAWFVLAAAACLAVFAYLLTLHPHPAGRVYAAYGGIYIGTALAWLWLVDGVRPDRWDAIGVTLGILGMAIIYFGPRA